MLFLEVKNITVEMLLSHQVSTY